MAVACEQPSMRTEVGGLSQGPAPLCLSLWDVVLWAKLIHFTHSFNMHNDSQLFIRSVDDSHSGSLIHTFMDFIHSFIVPSKVVEPCSAPSLCQGLSHALPSRCSPGSEDGRACFLYYLFDN